MMRQKNKEDRFSTEAPHFSSSLVIQLSFELRLVRRKHKRDSTTILTLGSVVSIPRVY